MKKKSCSRTVALTLLTLTIGSNLNFVVHAEKGRRSRQSNSTDIALSRPDSVDLSIVEEIKKLCLEKKNQKGILRAYQDQKTSSSCDEDEDISVIENHNNITKKIDDELKICIKKLYIGNRCSLHPLNNYEFIKTLINCGVDKDIIDEVTIPLINNTKEKLESCGISEKARVAESKTIDFTQKQSSPKLAVPKTLEEQRPVIEIKQEEEQQQLLLETKKQIEELKLKGYVQGYLLEENEYISIRSCISQLAQNLEQIEEKNILCAQELISQMYDDLARINEEFFGVVNTIYFKDLREELNVISIQLEHSLGELYCVKSIATNTPTIKIAGNKLIDLLNVRGAYVESFDEVDHKLYEDVKHCLQRSFFKNLNPICKILFISEMNILKLKQAFPFSEHVASRVHSLCNDIVACDTQVKDIINNSTPYNIHLKLNKLLSIMGKIFNEDILSITVLIN